jgi:hypothetical protein
MNNIESIPEEDGYYWVLLGAYNMHRLYLKQDTYTIVQLVSSTTDSSKRYIDFTEGGKRFSLKYFVERAKFGQFIKIIDPNKDL